MVQRNGHTITHLQQFWVRAINLKRFTTEHDAILQSEVTNHQFPDMLTFPLHITID